MIQVSKQAPDFEMEAVTDSTFTKIKLSDYRGKWVVLFFWPLDFTFICPTEVTAFSKRIAEFSHLAWQEQIGHVNYPMMSDITKEASRDYGILIEEEGIALRGLFIIDPDGILRYQVVHDLSIGRNVDEVLRVLKALQTGELCPVDWEDGAATLGKA